MASLAADRVPRRRRHVAPAVLSALRPLFRYSATRDAHVLRVVGNRIGPVLKPAYRDPARDR